MSINSDIAELTVKVEQLLGMLKPLEEQGDQSAKLFADGVRRRLADLRSHEATATRLLDIVPSAKDLDAINFRLDLYPEIEALSSDIEAQGARLAKSLLV